MLLIATDEAGYGPKLGPLVVTATVWRLPSLNPLQSLASLSHMVQPAGLPKLSVADSKQVFKPRQASGLLALEAIVMAALRWAWPQQPVLSLQQMLQQICPADLAQLHQQPWFSPAQLQQPFPQSPQLTDGPAEAADAACDAILNVWTAGGGQLVDIRQRTIDARHFNQLCGQGLNKAQLLSETTAGLVIETLQHHDDPVVTIYSDRHGGRAYYGGLLQHFLPTATLTVVSETPRESHYALQQPNRDLQWRFTVKGDSFAPVSLSSMFAKYTRERLMGCFNHYWQDQHPTPLQPTAGYPSDANRFLEDIQATVKRLKIRTEQLVRQR